MLVDDLVSIPLRHVEGLYHGVVDCVEQCLHLLDRPTGDQINDDERHRSGPKADDGTRDLKHDRLSGCTKHEFAVGRAILESDDDQAGPHFSTAARISSAGSLLLLVDVDRRSCDLHLRDQPRHGGGPRLSWGEAGLPAR